LAFNHAAVPKGPVATARSYEQRLCRLVEESAELMKALRAVGSLGLPSWCIGAGVIRSLVWDALHDRPEPTLTIDVDVAYFDADVSSTFDDQLQVRLSDLIPDIRWDVVNQARVHEWLVGDDGQPVMPLTSLEDGVATWPEFATCVGVYLDGDHAIRVIAPYGLSDLFDLLVRHNPRRASAATYMERVKTKRFERRWPRLRICMP
jgi:uncharacterized protein